MSTITETLSEAKVENYGKWLSHADPSTNHGLAHRYHHEETSLWLVKGDDDNKQFDEWKQKGTLFFVHGRSKWFVIRTISSPLMSLFCSWRW